MRPVMRKGEQYPVDPKSKQRNYRLWPDSRLHRLSEFLEAGLSRAEIAAELKLDEKQIGYGIRVLRMRIIKEQTGGPPKDP